MPPWPKDKLAHFREIEREFHERAFGDELARVNLDMTRQERLAYLEWMRALARKHGVKPDRSPFRIELPEEELSTD